MATINDILTEVDELKPNTYDDALKIKWLLNLDLMIYNNVIQTHEYNDGESEIEKPTGYTVNTELIAPDPYSELYKYFIFAQIDFNNNETDRYANSSAMFNNSNQEYMDYYNRTHLPKTQALQL